MLDVSIGNTKKWKLRYKALGMQKAINSKAESMETKLLQEGPHDKVDEPSYFNFNENFIFPPFFQINNNKQGWKK